MPDSLNSADSVWYKNGLRFSCTQCGKCCTGGPGYVWIDDEEMAEIAAFLNISVEDFILKYTRKVHGRIALLEDKTSFDCVFLHGRACKVYGARPRQCRTFPWWPENLKDTESWKETAKRCEGIQPEAPLVAIEDIQQQLNIHLQRKP